MPVVMKVTSNQFSCQNMLKRQNPLPVLLMCMQLTKRRLNQNLDVVMSHQQGKRLVIVRAKVCDVTSVV